MARAGITYSEVAKAALRLYEENKMVSADNVWNLIGSGSKTTLIKQLNAWKDGHILEAQANGIPLSGCAHKLYTIVLTKYNCTYKIQLRTITSRINRWLKIFGIFPGLI